MPELRKRDKEKLVNLIVEGLDGMATLERQAFTLKHYQGLPASEVAARLGVEETEVQAILKTAEILMRKKVRPVVLRQEPSGEASQEANMGLPGCPPFDCVSCT